MNDIVQPSSHVPYIISKVSAGFPSPADDYLENNLRFTLSVEPDNQIAQEWLPRAIAADPTLAPLVTCIGDEREFNSFFRLANTQIRAGLKCMNATEKEVFTALRSLRDSW